jgi:hypothetical protein
MRRTLAATIAASFIGGTFLLAGCSSGGWFGPSTLPSTTQSQVAHGVNPMDGTGLAPGVHPHAMVARPSHELPSASLVGLFVSEIAQNDMKVLKNGTYTPLGTITSGLNGPDGIWVDQLGNVYATNVIGKNVTEYAKNHTTVAYTYSAGLGDPITVTSDLHGNVFVGDYNFSANGFINEYKQHHNTVVATCAPGGGVEGLAVDTNGDVFAAYNVNGGGSANLVRYKHGLAGCHGTLLGVTLHFAGGMVLDSHHDLIVVDQTAPGVDVIKPPYTSVSTTFGVSQPFRVGLNKANTLLFVCEPNKTDVEVLKYPSGTLQTTVGTSNGLSGAEGVTDEPNAVF